MTNKEAQEKLYLEWQKFLENNLDYAGISKAYKMAFVALDQEPCNDCISRQAVLDLVNADWKYEGLEEPINSLPPVSSSEHPSIDEVLDKIRARIHSNNDNGGEPLNAVDRGYDLACQHMVKEAEECVIIEADNIERSEE